MSRKRIPGTKEQVGSTYTTKPHATMMPLQTEKKLHLKYIYIYRIGLLKQAWAAGGIVEDAP